MRVQPLLAFWLVACMAAKTEITKMISVKGGSFLMGTDDKPSMSDGEGPMRKVKVHGFQMDATAVTNAQFRAFVRSTKYKTEAETFGWSFVLSYFASKKVRKESQAVEARPFSTLHVFVHFTL